MAVAPAAATAAGIVVTLPGGEARLSADDVRNAVDRPAGTYLLRAPGTAAQPVAHPPALSVRRLVELAGGAPDAASFVTIGRPDGTLSVLRPGDLADPPPFPEGPPIFWIDFDSVRYLRPLRDASDANAADNLASAGEDLVVRVHQGPLLVVRVTATPAHPRVGQTVHLQAGVDGPAAPGRTFAWTFGDGAGAGGAAVMHRFREPGIYAVTATVTGADDSGGSSDPLVVRVGRPLRASGPPGGGRAPRRRAPAQGEATGETAPAKPPAHAQARPPRPDRAPAPARGRRRAPASTRTRAPAPARAPATPDVTARRPAPAATPRRDSASAQAKTTTAPPRPPARHARRRATSTKRGPETRRAPPAPPPARPAGPVVRGVLVAAASPVAGSAGPVVRGVRPAAARRGDPGSGPPWGVLGALAAAALVGIGAQRERRALRPRARRAT